MSDKRQCEECGGRGVLLEGGYEFQCETCGGWGFLVDNEVFCFVCDEVPVENQGDICACCVDEAEQ